MANGDEAPQAILELPLSFVFRERDGSERAGTEVAAVLDRDFLNVYPAAGDVLTFGFRDMEEVAGANHRISLTLGQQRELTLYHLGYKYDDFLRTLVKLRNEAAITDMLMHEKAHKPDYEEAYLYRDGEGRERRGPCLVRLYETAVAVIPEDSLVVRFRYSDLTRCEREGHTLALENEYGEKIVLSMLGYNFDPLRDNLLAGSRKLEEKVRQWLQEILPGAPGDVLAGTARLVSPDRRYRPVSG